MKQNLTWTDLIQIIKTMFGVSQKIIAENLYISESEVSRLVKGKTHELKDYSNIKTKLYDIFFNIKKSESMAAKMNNTEENLFAILKKVIEDTGCREVMKDLWIEEGAEYKDGQYYNFVNKMLSRIQKNPPYEKNNISDKDKNDGISKSFSKEIAANIQNDIKNYFNRMKEESQRLKNFYNNPEDAGYGTTFEFEDNNQSNKQIIYPPYNSLYNLYLSQTDSRIYWLEARGGYGKTYAMIRLYRDLIMNGVNSVYISARKFVKNLVNINECENLLTNFLYKEILNEKQHLHIKPCIGCKKLFNSTDEFIIILDSINESTDEVVEKLKIEIKNFIIEYPNIKFFISSRTNYNFEEINGKIINIKISLISKNSLKNELGDDEYDKLQSGGKKTQDMIDILKIPLMLNLYKATSKLISGNTKEETVYKELKIKKFYIEPVESLIIWNYYHAFVQKHLKDSDDGQEAFLHLLAIEFILPAIAYRLNRDTYRYEKNKEIEKLIVAELNRLDKQLRIRLNRFQTLPIRMADLNGHKLLLNWDNKKDNMTTLKNILSSNKPIISDEYRKKISKIIIETLNEKINPHDDHDKNLLGFSHECLIHCLSAQHIINSMRLPDFQIPGTDLYVSKLWIKHDFSGMDSVLYHYAELDRRKNGAIRLKEFSSMVFDVATFGEKEDNDNLSNDNRRIEKNVIDPETDLNADNKPYINHFRSNVNQAIIAFINCFKDHNDYLRFKIGDN